MIVAGGRGLGAPEGFALVEELAKALGGAVAATRAVVDAGWYPYAAQVGQTGKTVTPKLYIACGISGAIQHKVGMQGSGVVIAINKDPTGDLRVQRPRRRGRPQRRRAEAVRARAAAESRMTRPADYPPPFNADDAMPGTDPPDERIDVGILIVGAGPAGLACAIRIGQLLEEHPELADRLGEVPVAVLEKGKAPGAHLLSGAVVNPRGFHRLFKGSDTTVADMPFCGPVEHEAVYVLRRGSALRIPAPPTMRNHGNQIASLSQLGRWLADKAEEGGAAILPETAATKLLVDHGRVYGVRTGDRGRARDGGELKNFEAGSDLGARSRSSARARRGISPAPRSSGSAWRATTRRCGRSA